MTQEELIRFVSDGFDRAKGGNAIDTYRQVLPFFSAGQLPLKSHYAFGWIAYYALHQHADHEISERKQILATYLRLSLAKPHKLHSMILTEAIRLYRNAKETAYNRQTPRDVPHFSIVRFSALWNLANLRPGDWRRKEYEGKTMSSTAEKLITLYVDELEHERQPAPVEFMAVMEKALQDFPDSHTLLSQRAALHILVHEEDEARSMLRRALLNAPGKFFLWSRLASVVSPKADVRRNVALLYRALTSPGPEQFKGRIRISLAQAWIWREAWQQALFELLRVKQIYEANGWHLPQSFNEAMRQIPKDTVPADPTDLYRRVEHLADEEIYDALPTLRVTKTYHKKPEPDSGRQRFGPPITAWRVTDERGNNYWLQPHRFSIPEDLPIGTALDIRLHNNRPVKASLVMDNDK